MMIRTISHFTLSFLAGLAVALALHLMLYRMTLPLKPFIYVVF